MINCTFFMIHLLLLFLSLVSQCKSSQSPPLFQHDFSIRVINSDWWTNICNWKCAMNFTNCCKECQIVQSPFYADKCSTVCSLFMDLCEKSCTQKIKFEVVWGSYNITTLEKPMADFLSYDILFEWFYPDREYFTNHVMMISAKEDCELPCKMKLKVFIYYLNLFNL